MRHEFLGTPKEMKQARVGSSAIQRESRWAETGERHAITSAHSKKLFRRRSRPDVGKYVYRVTDKWNNLPQCCMNCTTLNNFKSHIHKVLEPETE